MHIQFQSIRIKRFRSFHNEAVFEFDAAGPGLYFLKGKNETSSGLGSNGSGKSSIIDALMWCLYGKTVQGLKNPDIVPWTGKGKTEVEVRVEVAGKIKRIQRALNPNLLTVDGTEVGQDYIATLIPIPMGLVPYTIVLGQKQPLFFDLTASEKMKVFSECLDLERWEERSAHASELTKKLEREIQSKETEVVSLERELKTIVSDTDTIKEQSKLWEAARSLKLASAEKDIALFKKQIAAVMPERDTADLKRESADTELKAFTDIFNTLDRQERQLAETIANLLKDNEFRLEDTKKLKDQLDAVSNEVCPTCNQPIQLKVQLDKVKNSIKSKIKANNDLSVSFLKTIGEAQIKHNEVEASIQVQEKAREQFEEDSREAWNVLSRLDPQISAWQASIRLLEKQLTEKEEMNNPHTERLQTLRKRKNTTESALESTQKAIKVSQEQCERTRYWIKGFKDIKLLIVEEILQELELQTNSMLEEFGLGGWNVHFDIERETKSGSISRGLNISILSPNNKTPVKWEVWSGGEAQRLKLIGTAALSSVLLNHVGVSTNLEVYDEPTIGLSTEGVRDLVELLSLRAKTTDKSIWLIDHHAILSAKFLSTVTVIKDKSGSRIEQD